MAFDEAGFNALLARVVKVEKNLGLYQAAVEEAVTPPAVPDDTFNVEYPEGETKTYKFRVPTFYHNRSLYIAEEVVADIDSDANQALVLALVTKSYNSDDVFVPGVLEEAESES